MDDLPQLGGGEKRAMEVEGGDAVKRRRIDGVVSGGEEERRRVAELVLVLSAMGRMRGGREPTVLEAAMMMEARKKVAGLCEVLLPKDIVPREVFGGVIDDLGLNRLKDQRSGFRAPKLSISEKIALSKRRMEESKNFTAQPASYSSQRVQSGSGTTGETCGTPEPVSTFSADNVGHMPVSSSWGAFQPPTSAFPPPVLHSSRAASTPRPLHLPSTEARPPVSSTSVPNNTGKDSTSAAPPRVDRAVIRPDGRLNVPSSVPHVPVISADQLTVTTAPVLLQPQPASRIVVGAQNKTPDQLAVRTANASSPQTIPRPVVLQTLKTVPNQAASGIMMHHPVKSLQYNHPPVVNHHLEISKAIYRLLNPKLPQCPSWTPPSWDYMSKAHPCQFCKVIIIEVETLVVCDACEKAFHVGCLQSYNAKSIPKGEWYCPRCLTTSHGKPFPPKYGRVTRNMSAPKGPSNTSIAQFPSDNKMEKFNEKMTQSDTTTNGNPVIRTKSQIIKSAAETPSGSKMFHESYAGGIVASAGIKKEDRSNPVSCPNKINRAAVDSVLTASPGSCRDKPYQHVMRCELSHPEDGFINQAESGTHVIPQANSASGNMPTASNLNDFGHKVPNGVQSSLLQFDSSNGFDKSNQIDNNEICENDAPQRNVAANGGQVQAEEIVNTSESGLHHVDWIGETEGVVNGNKFFQSCRINGVVYRLQEYALFRSRNGNLAPLLLKGMWEDCQTNSKWLIVHKCYFPDDLPQEAGHPGAPQSNEVYESIHDSNMMAGFIQGPCEVLPFRKFGEESETSIECSQAHDRICPVFIRNWFYDERKQAFRPSAS